MKETMSATAIAPTISLSISFAKLLSELWIIIDLTKMNRVTPVPSLKSDSFSITEHTFFERPILFRIPVAAIGSVGETTHPRSMHIHISIGILNAEAIKKKIAP